MAYYHEFRFTMQVISPHTDLSCLIGAAGTCAWRTHARCDFVVSAPAHQILLVGRLTGCPVLHQMTEQLCLEHQLESSGRLRWNCSSLLPESHSRRSSSWSTWRKACACAQVTALLQCRRTTGKVFDSNWCSICPVNLPTNRTLLPYTLLYAGRRSER